MLRQIKFLLFIIINLAFSAKAIQTIIIDQGSSKPIPIAVNYFASDNKLNANISNEITSVITSDLKNSGLFMPISPAAFIENKYGAGHKPLFAAWQAINTHLLVNGKIEEKGKIVKITFDIWDILAGNLMVSEFFEVEKSEIIKGNLGRRVAHQIANRIFEEVTGDKGHFDTKILYVAEHGSFNKRVKRIAIMDYDGANHKYLTDGKDIVLGPIFAQNTKDIIYLSYKRKLPHIYTMDLTTGKSKILGNFNNMAFSPCYSPDGKKIVLSVAGKKNVNLFEFDLTTMQTKRLTMGPCIDTSPSYSPDGKKIVFNSNRSGRSQLYIMDSNGDNVRRISFGSGDYRTPVWSPKGDKIAFTKITKAEGFTIGVLMLDNQSGGNEYKERLIASGYLVEGPCWSPNGRFVLFTREERPSKYSSNKSKLFYVDVKGSFEKEVSTPQDASDASWSNFL